MVANLINLRLKIKEKKIKEEDTSIFLPGFDHEPAQR